MDDLISRAAAIEEIARRDMTDGTVKVYSGREINAMLGDLPTIAAIPVEWLRKYDDAFDNVMPISSALRAWEEGGIA